MAEIVRAEDVAGAAAIVSQFPDLGRLSDSPGDFYVDQGSFLIQNSAGYHVCRVSYREDAWWCDFSDYGDEVED